MRAKISLGAHAEARAEALHRARDRRQPLVAVDRCDAARLADRPFDGGGMPPPLEERRCGEVEAALAAYRANDRIVAAPTASDGRRGMVAGWWAHRVAGDTTAMVAYRRNDVDDLNGRARAYLTRTCQVSGPGMFLYERP